MTWMCLPAMVFLWACASEEEPRQEHRPSVTPTTDPTIPAEVHRALEVSSAVSDVVPTVHFVNWTADLGRGRVEYGLTPELGLATPYSDSAESHERAVLGLKAGQQYHWRVVHEHEDGTVATSPIETWSVAAPPEAFDPYELKKSELDRSEVAGSFLVLSQNDDETGYAAIVDGDADLVWWAQAEAGQRITRSRLSLDGSAVLWSSYEKGNRDANGVIHRLSLDGRSSTKTRAWNQHHDFVEREDGTLAFLSFEYEVHDVDNESMDVASDVIRIAPEGFDEEREYDRVFSFFADYPHAPWWSCSHMSLNGSFIPGYNEWSHSNSIAYEPIEDAYYILPRFFDALLKIDGTTGDLIWQMGGIHGDFTSDEGPDLLQHAHFSHVWPGGVLLFDNGNHGDQISRAIEYHWDETDMTVDKAWDYTRADEGYTPHLGDARRLPGGNTLILYSPTGELREVDPEGLIVWRAVTAVTAGRVVWVSDIY